MKKKTVKGNNEKTAAEIKTTNIPCVICGEDTGIPVGADMDEQDPVCGEKCHDKYAYPEG